MSRLQRELVMLFFGGRMPEELQLTCVSSPARRSLLASLPLNAAQEGRVQQLLDMLQVGGVTASAAGREEKVVCVGGGSWRLGGGLFHKSGGAALEPPSV